MNFLEEYYRDTYPNAKVYGSIPKNMHGHVGTLCTTNEIGEVTAIDFNTYCIGSSVNYLENLKGIIGETVGNAKTLKISNKHHYTINELRGISPYGNHTTHADHDDHIHDVSLLDRKLCCVTFGKGGHKSNVRNIPGKYESDLYDMIPVRDMAISAEGTELAKGSDDNTYQLDKYCLRKVYGTGNNRVRYYGKIIKNKYTNSSNKVIGEIGDISILKVTPGEDDLSVGDDYNYRQNLISSQANDEVNINAPKTDTKIVGGNTVNHPLLNHILVPSFSIDIEVTNSELNEYYSSPEYTIGGIGGSSTSEFSEIGICFGSLQNLSVSYTPTGGGTTITRSIKESFGTELFVKITMGTVVGLSTSVTKYSARFDVNII